MQSPAFKRKEREAFEQAVSQSALAPDTLSPKISKVQSEGIFTSKNPHFAPTLMAIRFICEEFTKREVV